MKPLNLKYQGGVVLILFVLMLMGIGGILFVGYSEGLLKQVELSKFEHNRRVLNEAKQALLQFAYNYPQFNSEGPGRLPCPDDDNDGLTGTLSLALCQSVGRLPWAEVEMIFYDARDSDEERLWYAVSDQFYNLGGGPIINSDSVGSITLVDQSQNIIYDGNVAGIAAIVIATGSAIARDEDDNGTYEYTQVRGTVGQQNDPRNYLDTFNGFVNDTFNNGESDTDDDGFILGPIRESDPASPAFNTIVVNDQFIVITAAEVIEVAEKATLQAYRKTIEDYLAVTGNVYPWLYNYAGVPDIPGLSSYYPANLAWATEKGINLDNFGRIPSLFLDYYTEATGVSPGIESRIDIQFVADFLGPIAYNRTNPSAASGNLIFENIIWDGSPAPVYNSSIGALTSQPVTELNFTDVADVMGADVNLIGTFAVDQTFTTAPVWFWDDNGPNQTNKWRKCEGLGDDITDCHVDSGYLPDPQGPGDHNIFVMKVVLTLTFDSSSVDQFEVTLDTANMEAGFPVITPADTNAHALYKARYPGGNPIPAFSTPMLVINYEIDNSYEDGGMGSFDVDQSGTMDFNSIDSALIDLEFRYYPELPAWVFSNGWHNSVMMAHAFDYRPDQVAPCLEGTDCIQINSLAGNNDNKKSILTIAGQHDWDADLDSNFINDLPTIFDAENADILDIDGTEYLFDRRELGGNDKILVIEEI